MSEMRGVEFTFANERGNIDKHTMKMYLEKENCICYNASRQKVMTFHVDKRNEPPHRVTAQFGGSSFLFTVAKNLPVLIRKFSKHLS